MAQVDTDRIISISAASKNLSALVDDVELHGYSIISRRNAPAAAVIPIHRFTELQEAEMRWESDYEESRDWMLTIARVITDGGNRTTLDDVLEKFGYTRSELEALDD